MGQSVRQDLIFTGRHGHSGEGFVLFSVIDWRMALIVGIGVLMSIGRPKSSIRLSHPPIATSKISAWQNDQATHFKPARKARRRLKEAGSFTRSLGCFLFLSLLP
jgi:hypothetical protein